MASPWTHPPQNPKTFSSRENEISPRKPKVRGSCWAYKLFLPSSPPPGKTPTIRKQLSGFLRSQGGGTHRRANSSSSIQNSSRIHARPACTWRTCLDPSPCPSRVHRVAVCSARSAVPQQQQHQPNDVARHALVAAAEREGPANLLTDGKSSRPRAMQFGLHTSTAAGLEKGRTRPGAQSHPPPPLPGGCPLGCTWPTARAVGLLRVDATQSSETGAVWGLRWHNPPRERNEEWGGRDRPGREREGTWG